MRYINIFLLIVSVTILYSCEKVGPEQSAVKPVHGASAKANAPAEGKGPKGFKAAKGEIAGLVKNVGIPLEKAKKVKKLRDAGLKKIADLPLVNGEINKEQRLVLFQAMNEEIKTLLGPQKYKKYSQYRKFLYDKNQARQKANQ